MISDSKKTNPKLIEGYVIGVDGGGTKTIAALSDLNGKILYTGKANPSSPRNVGIKIAVKNITQAIKKTLKKKKQFKILVTFIGLPAVAEEYKTKKNKIKKELLKQKEISIIFKGKVVIGSDQIIAFRSGTDEKEGVLIIAGTGCVARGWSKNKDIHTSGWGWLADAGSAFWAGQQAYRAIMKELDGRGPKTLITESAFKKLGIKKDINTFNALIYKNPTKLIPLLSIACDLAAVKGDKAAEAILKEAGKNLALAAATVIKKLKLKNKKFPLVLVGGMFNSKIVFNTVIKEVKKIAPKAEFIRPKTEPVKGAVKLAIEQVS